MNKPCRIDREIKRLVKYNWADEEKNYWECEPKERRRHIFKVLRYINQSLHLGMKENPEYRGWDLRQEEVA